MERSRNAASSAPLLTLFLVLVAFFASLVAALDFDEDEVASTLNAVRLHFGFQQVLPPEATRIIAHRDLTTWLDDPSALEDWGQSLDGDSVELAFALDEIVEAGSQSLSDDFRQTFSRLDAIDRVDGIDIAARLSLSWGRTWPNQERLGAFLTSLSSLRSTSLKEIRLVRDGAAGARLDVDRRRSVRR